MRSKEESFTQNLAGASNKAQKVHQEEQHAEDEGASLGTLMNNALARIRKESSLTAAKPARRHVKMHT